MKAVIWGVSGQDGSYLAEYLLSLDYEVVGVKRRSSGASLWRLENALASSNFSLIEGDITDFSSVFNILNLNLDEIYNLAAQSNVGTSFNQPGYTWDVTAKGVLNLLEVMRLTNSTAKLYQASSSEMFGTSCDFDTSKVVYNEKGIPMSTGVSYQNEETRFAPQSPYAIAKLSAHNLIQLYRQAYGLYAVGGILFNHESPRRGLGFVTRKITNHFYRLHRGLTKGKLQLGNLDSFRDWGYAKEYVVAMHKMLQNSSPKDYVIGTGETHSVREFLDRVISLTCRGYTAEDLVEISDSCKRPAEVSYLKADASLANVELAWTPKVKFNELVELMINEENGQS